MLGIAGATLAPSTLSLIRTMFHDPRQRTVAISVWTAGFAGGGALGPIVGGLLLENLWWGSAFLINVPAMVLLLALGPVLLPEFRHPNPGRFDLGSAALSLAAVLPIIYGIKKIAEDVAVSWQSVLPIVAGVVLGLVFLRRQRRPDPMIDVGLFRKRQFSTSIGTSMLAGFVMLGFARLSSQYMQLVLGLSPFEAALWNLPIFGAMMVGTTLAAMFAGRIQPGYIVGAGLALGAAGFAALTQLGVDNGLALLVGAVSATTLGMGAVMAAVTDLVVATAPAERAGAASAISETGNEFGSALGMAILGSVGVAVYRSEIVESVPAGLPPEAVDAARDTLGGAVAVAGQLPEPAGVALLDAAREAFTQGMHAAATTGAVVMAVSAVLAIVLLRSVQTVSPAIQHDASRDTAQSEPVTPTEVEHEDELIR